MDTSQPSASLVIQPFTLWTAVEPAADLCENARLQPVCRGGNCRETVAVRREVEPRFRLQKDEGRGACDRKQQPDDSAGKLAAGKFNALSAQDGNDVILYDKGTGKLYHDPDGLGGAALTHFATLANKADLKAGDIIIV